MLEHRLRAAFPKLQHLYDRMPSPLRNVLVSARGYVLTRMRYQRAFWDCLEGLRERETWTVAAMEAFQQEQLQQLLRYAQQSVPYYQQVFAASKLQAHDIRSVEDLPKIPVLTREMVRRHGRQLLSMAVPEKQRIQVFTSGTSGAGLAVCYNTQALVTNWAFAARQKLWAGVRPGDWRLSFFGSRVVPLHRRRPPFWAYNYFEKQILFSIFHLADASKEAYVRFLQAHPNLLVEGFPTVLYTMANFLVQDQVTVPSKAIFTDGEPLYPHLRQKIGTAFDAKVYDTYGMTEWAGLIQECEAGSHHLVSDYGILEVVDDENRPVPPGHEGYLVWTGFVNRVMPLIRYRVGDKGMWEVEQSCPCRRPFPRVHPTITRESDYLIAPDQRVLSPRALNQLLKNKVSFQSCQFIQHDQDTITVRIVPGGRQAQEEAEDVQKGLRKMLGDAMHIAIEVASEPLQNRGGKIPLILSTLGKQYSAVHEVRQAEGEGARP